MTFDPSPARRGLDALLRAYPFFDLIHVDWQVAKSDHVEPGPWVLVQLGQPSDGPPEQVGAWAVWYFAIWKRTGAVYSMPNAAGPVGDDPILEPAVP